ncbi:nucleoside 2-deoxyribosyltransferase [Paraliobacillus ryukyuensis]|uniref:nucleoside 2-deoxyribosyltransferase n=1 Tax=Paraliobacillus ryukyuensis TaxID=200904 RepID=UPI0009A70019|nr:nucleoside 2-deoxyribosyltransferase [Paraliobacillus ryukyuensis]
MTKVYLAHPISTKGEFEDSKRVANEIRKLGYQVYAAAENASINNKSNNPTPQDIYRADVSELISSDIVVVNLTGGSADGTITEIGIVAGWNESELMTIDGGVIDIIAYTSNARLLQPQLYKGIPSASANHLTLGAIEEWGEFVGNEEDLLMNLARLD